MSSSTLAEPAAAIAGADVLFALQLRIARRADELATVGPWTPAADRRFWLAAECEVMGHGETALEGQS